MPDVLPSAPSDLQRRVRRRTDESEPLRRVRRGLLEQDGLPPGPVRDGVRGRSALLRWRVRRLGLEPAPLRPVRQRVRRLGALRVRQLRAVVPTDDRALRRRVRLDAARRSALRTMRSNVWRGPVVPQRCMRDGMPCAAHRLRVRHVCRFEERSAPLRRMQPAVPAPSAEPACLRRERVRPGCVPARLRGLQRRRDGWLRGAAVCRPVELRAVRHSLQPGRGVHERELWLPAASGAVPVELHELHGMRGRALVPMPQPDELAGARQHLAEPAVSDVLQLQREPAVHALLTRTPLHAFLLAGLVSALATCATRPGPGTCSDGQRAGEESDVDCGGAACAPCANEAACFASDDCASRVCVRGRCAAPSCRDGQRAGDETDIDCGGPCGPCVIGAACVVGRDCQAGVCANGRCAPPSCADGLRNGAESDVDCGGGCPPCAVDAGCGRNTDCGAAACLDGRCVTGCVPPLKACGASCTDARVDPLNCGACGAVCPPGLSCVGGNCELRCPAGLTACAGSCVDLAATVVHCGACGVMCPPGRFCVAGQCETGCPPGRVACGPQCVRVDSDSLNCGTCGRACAPGQGCFDAGCQDTCAPPLRTCDGGCVDPRFDPDHCNGCGQVCPTVANAARLCLNGMCGRANCTFGFGECNANPADGCETSLRTNQNCGACGVACSQGQGCDAGVCH
jgi:hypothetical protein